MWEAIQLAGIFIDAGPVASVKDKDGKVIMLKDPNRGTMYDGPIIILTNGRSASASEFFSAAMQDYNRALIVGGTTYGKGTAQGVKPLDTLQNGSPKDYKDFAKVTMEKFYRVNGNTVQWKGVEPDIALPDIYAGGEHERSNASALTPDQSKPGYYQPLNPLPVASLQQKSAARVAADPYYNKMNELLSRTKALEKGLDVPLDRAGFNTFHQKFYDGTDSKEFNETALNVSDNNSYDKEKIAAGSAQSKEANDTYLKQLAQSHDLSEACKILADLISGK